MEEPPAVVCFPIGGNDGMGHDIIALPDDDHIPILYQSWTWRGLGLIYYHAIRTEITLTCLGPCCWLDSGEVHDGGGTSSSCGGMIG